MIDAMPEGAIRRAGQCDRYENNHPPAAELHAQNLGRTKIRVKVVGRSVAMNDTSICHDVNAADTSGR